MFSKECNFWSLFGAEFFMFQSQLVSTLAPRPTVPNSLTVPRPQASTTPTCPICKWLIVFFPCLKYLNIRKVNAKFIQKSVGPNPTLKHGTQVAGLMLEIRNFRYNHLKGRRIPPDQVRKTRNDWKTSPMAAKVKIATEKWIWFELKKSWWFTWSIN